MLLIYLDHLRFEFCLDVFKIQQYYIFDCWSLCFEVWYSIELYLFNCN